MTTTFIKGIGSYNHQSDIPVIATIGTFDGIHRGHQEIFRRVREQSKENGAEPVLITFHPHPRMLVTPDSAPLLLTTIEEKGKFVPDFFDGKVLILDFNKDLMNTPAVEFVKKILVEKIGVRKLIVGYDHTFGYDRHGDIPALKVMGAEMGFEVEVVEPVVEDNKPVSSSRIRRAIIDGRYQEALNLLGHDYAIYGTVEHGIGMGYKLGYPTANISYSHRKLLPSEGVYACWAEVDNDCYSGMMFIGRNSLNPEDCVSVEANLFEFDSDIYNKEITVYPIRFIRENRKFELKDKLIEQIEQDKKQVLNTFEKELSSGIDKRAKSSNHC
ncbi:MAG: bifunctional riboflavin kinase/FAD synthetase [candidate division Zixibacteria bacterium]|nr:bifunctional riboflavin kinase/FAD synthetase [candidate division Zixibacteria bacterium]